MIILFYTTKWWFKTFHDHFVHRYVYCIFIINVTTDFRIIFHVSVLFQYIVIELLYKHEKNRYFIVYFYMFIIECVVIYSFMLMYLSNQTDWWLTLPWSDTVYRVVQWTCKAFIYKWVFTICSTNFLLPFCNTFIIDLGVTLHIITKVFYYLLIIAPRMFTHVGNRLTFIV